MGNLLASAIEELTNENVSDVDVDTLGADLIELRCAIDRLEADWHRRLGAFDRRGGWQRDGTLSTGAWLRHHCRLAHSAAHERVQISRQLDELPETAAAFAAGDIGLAHVRLVTAATADVDRPTVRDAETVLVDAARTLDPSALRRVITHWRHAVDANQAWAAAEQTYLRRRLHCSSTFEGTVAIDGLLDPEGGATVRAALEALSTPHGGDTRTPAQRRADALVELARQSLDHRELPTTGSERPHVTVTVELATLQRQAGAPAAEIEWGEPICGETARRIACDSGISRVITDGASQPLDVGRRTPTVPVALRRALITRDRGCTHPGCDRPPQWTDAHHIVHWIDGGNTALDNLTLLCRTHHRLVHEGNAHQGDRSPP